MKLKTEKKQNSFEKEYAKFMKGYNFNNQLPNQGLQWTRPNDIIVKFSLYQETPNSITSTETSANLSY